MTETIDRNCDTCRHSSIGSTTEPCLACLTAMHDGQPFGSKWEPRDIATPSPATPSSAAIAAPADDGRGGSAEPPRPLSGAIVVMLTAETYTRERVADIFVALGARVLNA